MLLREGQTFRAYNAFCPHRGANLAIGGKLVGNTVICPFHGCAVGLQHPSEEGYSLTEYKLLSIGGCLFVHTDPLSGDFGFEERMVALDQDHYIIPGFELVMNVTPEMVIENAFDQLHFRTVHSILNEPVFTVDPASTGAFRIDGTFVLPLSAWQKGRPGQQSIDVPYSATAYSPFLVVSSLGGDQPYTVITSARQNRNNQTCISLSIAVPIPENGARPDLQQCRYLIDQSRKGLELDKVIWENRSLSFNRLRTEEKAVIGFQRFCRQFN